MIDVNTLQFQAWSSTNNMSVQLGLHPASVSISMQNQLPWALDLSKHCVIHGQIWNTPPSSLLKQPISQIPALKTQRL